MISHKSTGDVTLATLTFDFEKINTYFFFVSESQTKPQASNNDQTCLHGSTVTDVIIFERWIISFDGSQVWETYRHIVTLKLFSRQALFT